MPKIYFVNGPDKGGSVEFTADRIYIGRAPDSDVQIKEISVSRNHLKVIRKGEKYLIEDLKSTNGTYINGEHILPGQEYEVDEGIPVALGKIVITLGKPYEDLPWVTQDSIDLSKLIGDQRRSFQIDRPMSAKKNMELIYRVSEILKNSTNINASLEEVLTHVFDLLKRIDRAVFILIDAETGEFSKVIIRFKKDSDSTVSMYSRTIVDRVMQEGKAVIMLDTAKLEKADLSESMEMMQVKSVMCVPLVSRGDIRGVIYLDSVTSPYGFRREDLALISALCSPAAIAVENAALYSNLQTSGEYRPPRNL